MGFAKPKVFNDPAPVPTPAPPPVRQSDADIQLAADATRKRQAARKGYAATLLSPAMADAAGAKKTLLG